MVERRSAASNGSSVIQTAIDARGFEGKHPLARYRLDLQDIWPDTKIEQALLRCELAVPSPDAMLFSIDSRCL